MIRRSHHWAIYVLLLGAMLTVNKSVMLNQIAFMVLIVTSATVLLFSDLRSVSMLHVYMLVSSFISIKYGIVSRLKIWYGHFIKILQLTMELTGPPNVAA